MRAFCALGSRGPSRTAHERAPMPTAPMRRALLPVLLATALTAGVAAVAASPAIAASAPAASSTVVNAATAKLAHDLSDAGTVLGSFEDDKGNTITYTDWGRTLDAAIALLAAGGHDETLGRTLTSVEDPAAVAAYTQGAPGDKA